MKFVTESGRGAPDRIKSSNNQKLKRLDLIHRMHTSHAYIAISHVCRYVYVIKNIIIIARV